ncbi:MAG: hypothetical protein GC155_18040 [Alphaproteobacteria bacterium]|nr:hypothetical protein [Alphaproteobacteria bacterium]
MSNGADGKVPVMESVQAAWRFFFANWKQFLPAAAAFGVVGALIDLFVLAQGGAAAGMNMGGMLLQFASSAVIGAVFVAVVLRKAVRNETHGPMGLAFGADELRLIGVTASLALLFVPFLLLGGVVLTVVVFSRLGITQEQLQTLATNPDALSNLIEDRIGAGGLLAFSLFMLIVAAIVVWVAVRLALIQAATIGERRVMIFQTWRWTHDNFWRVLAAMALTAIPAEAIYYVVTSLLAEISGAGKASTGAAEYLIVSAIIGFVGAMSQIPQLALVAHLYKGLRPPDFQPK